MSCLTEQWGSLGKAGKWAATVSTGIASVIGAYFALMGAADVIDTWVITEAEAGAINKQQVEIFDQYGKDLADERMMREIGDIQIDLDRLSLTIRYLNNLQNRTPDQTLEMNTLIRVRDNQRKRLKYLRCINDGRSPDVCSG
jgi:hypothetical protein